MKKMKALQALGISMLLTTSVLMISTGCSKDTAKETAQKESSQSEAPSQAPAIETSIPLYLSETHSLADTMGEGTTYESKNEEVAAVSESGMIEGMKKGSTQIIATNADGSTTFHVKVRKRGMVYPSFSMMKGETLTPQFNNEETGVTWTSNDESIAKITKQGDIKAKQVGSAIITGTGVERTYQCTLTVTKKIKSVIYLTFDDGPSRAITPQILDTLKANDVKATFFELRPASTDYDLTQRVIDEGHTLALHGFKHKYDEIYQSEEIYHENLDKLQSLFFRKFGVWCNISRFPGGSSNTVSHYNPGIMTRLTGLLSDWGYHYFDWSLGGEDAGVATTAEGVFAPFKAGLMKGRSNVMLNHDSTDKQYTADALQEMIDYGKENGYTFLPITASTEECHHGVNN